MASIIEFRRPGFMERSHTSRGSANASADVVLFPGVRYERHAEVPEQAKPKTRRSRRRDHLELDD